MPYGIDVSHYQGVIDWAKVKASITPKIEFAICKATEGISFTDDRFQVNRKNAKAQAIAVGGYHFFRPQYDAEEQANHFYATVGDLKAGDVIPWIDVEFIDDRTGVSPADAVQRLAMMVLYCEERFGKLSGITGNVDFNYVSSLTPISVQKPIGVKEDLQCSIGIIRAELAKMETLLGKLR